MDFKNIEKQGERKIYLPNSGKQPFSHTLTEHMDIFSILHRCFCRLIMDSSAQNFSTRNTFLY